MTGITKTEKYTFLYKRLVHSTHIVRQDTGEEIAIPTETETLYSYMRDQYESYKAIKKPFFESQESMGLKLKGRDRRWIAARIEVLNRLGLVKSEEQERDSYGHKRFHHIVIPLEGDEGVAENLLFYGPASISGGILAEGMLIRPLEKKKPRGKPKSKKAVVDHPIGDALHRGSATGTAEQTNEEKKGNGEQAQQQEHEQPATDGPETASTAAGEPDGVSDIHSDQHDDVSVNDAVNGAEHSRQCETPPVLAVNGAESEQWETPQRADIFDLKLWREEGPSGFGFMEYGKEYGETDVDRIAALIDQHYFDALPIFDEDGVVTEEFIDALSGDAAPKRNDDDGTLQSFRYVYWVARYSQDERDGIPVRTREEYMDEAKPEHIPAHLLPDREPEQDFSNETIPY